MVNKGAKNSQHLETEESHVFLLKNRDESRVYRWTGTGRKQLFRPYWIFKKDKLQNCHKKIVHLTQSDDLVYMVVYQNLS